MFNTNGGYINKLEQEISENLDNIDYDKLSEEDRDKLIESLTIINNIVRKLNVKTNQ